MKWKKYSVQVQCYLDDVIDAGSSQNELDERLAKVLRRIEEAGFQINGEKFLILKHSLRFMGLVISKDGIAPDPEKS